MKLKADYKNLYIDQNMIGVHQTKLFWMIASVCEIKGGQIDNVFRKYYQSILSKMVIGLLSIWNVYLDMLIIMINVYCFLLMPKIVFLLTFWGGGIWINRSEINFGVFMPPRSKIGGHIVFVLSVILSLSFCHSFQNFNLGYNIWIVSTRALIFHMSIPCDKTFPLVPDVLT